jgi:hypothetical protein
MDKVSLILSIPGNKKRLNEQVRRNLSRYPDDFMFLRTAREK